MCSKVGESESGANSGDEDSGEHPAKGKWLYNWLNLHLEFRQYFNKISFHKYKSLKWYKIGNTKYSPGYICLNCFLGEDHEFEWPSKHHRQKPLILHHVHKNIYQHRDDHGKTHYLDVGKLQAILNSS